MRHPIYVRPITETEREQLQAGLRSSDAFVLRRCQILLASRPGVTPVWWTVDHWFVWKRIPPFRLLWKRDRLMPLPPGWG